MKKSTKIVLGSLLVLGLIGACSDTEETEVKEEQVQTEQAEEQEVEEEVVVEEEAEEIVLPGIGEVAEAKKYSLVVNEVYETTVLTSDNMFQDDLVTEGKFIVIDLTIKNKQNVSESYSDYDLRLVSGDMKFNALDTLDINIIFEDYLSFVEVNPQMSTTNILVFEVPADLNSYNLTMGIFDTVEIELK